MTRLHFPMCCALPPFAEAGLNPLKEQFSTSSMLALIGFYVLRSFGTILWNGFIDLMMIAFASVHR